MFVGHFGLGLAAKRVAPRVSLGALFLSVQFADCLWPVLLLAGVEEVRIVPGLMRASSLDFVRYQVSHSLLALAVWGLLFGLLYGLARRDRIGSRIFGPPPPTERALAWTALAGWLVVPWGWWIDWHRKAARALGPPRPDAGARRVT